MFNGPVTAIGLMVLRNVCSTTPSAFSELAIGGLDAIHGRLTPVESPTGESILFAVDSQTSVFCQSGGGEKYQRKLRDGSCTRLSVTCPPLKIHYANTISRCALHSVVTCPWRRCCFTEMRITPHINSISGYIKLLNIYNMLYTLHPNAIHACNCDAHLWLYPRAPGLFSIVHAVHTSALMRCVTISISHCFFHSRMQDTALKENRTTEVE